MMDIFDEFMDFLGNYSKEELSDIRYWYARALTATDYTTIKAAAQYTEKIVTGNDSIVFTSSVKDLNKLPYTLSDAARGIHVIRSLFAREVVRLRARKMDKLPDYVNRYILDGYVVIPNFFGRNFRKVEKISELLNKFPLSVNKSPQNILYELHPANYLELHELVWNTDLRQIIANCMMLNKDDDQFLRLYQGNTFVQRVQNNPGDGDVQKIMHMDTYFDALKFWYFPDEVTLEMGPFVYSPMSTSLSMSRLKWMQESYMRFYTGEIEPERTYGHAEGSLRVLPHELKQMCLEEKNMVVDRDTLVIANVFGFHRRGEALIDSTRNAVHGSIRLDTPFIAP